MQSGATQANVESLSTQKYEVTPAAGQVYVNANCPLGASGHRSMEIHAIWYDE